MKPRHAAAVATFFLTTFATAHAQTESAAMDHTAILTKLETMTRAFATGDMEIILSTYEAGAVVNVQPGNAVRGIDSLRAIFGQFIA